MSIKIALAGNPNCGKTTLFNSLTGSNQFVGNWPGVTVEKKEGKLKGHKDVTVIDLPGIYSISPYTLEEVVTRKYLLEEKPDVILTTGAAVAIPMCIIGKIFGKKVIYIESYARINSPNKTGKLIYKFADLFIIQWEELRRFYPKAVYGGAIY